MIKRSTVYEICRRIVLHWADDVGKYVGTTWVTLAGDACMAVLPRRWLLKRCACTQRLASRTTGEKKRCARAKPLFERREFKLKVLINAFQSVNSAEAQAHKPRVTAAWNGTCLSRSLTCNKHGKSSEKKRINMSLDITFVYCRRKASKSLSLYLLKWPWNDSAALRQNQRVSSQTCARAFASLRPDACNF